MQKPARIGAGAQPHHKVTHYPCVSRVVQGDAGSYSQRTLCRPVEISPKGVRESFIRRAATGRDFIFASREPLSATGFSISDYWVPIHVQNVITLFTPRTLLCAFVISALSACGGSSYDGDVVTVEGVGMDRTINRADPYDLEVKGVRNDVTVSAGNTVLRLSVDGLNNRVYVLKNASIEQIDLHGTGNTVYVPVGFKSRISRNGSNNEVIER